MQYAAGETRSVASEGPVHAVAHGRGIVADAHIEHLPIQPETVESEHRLRCTVIVDLHTPVAGRRRGRASVAEIVGRGARARDRYAVRNRVAVRPKLDVAAGRRRAVHDACDVRLHVEVRHVALVNLGARQRGDARLRTRGGEGIHRRPYVLHRVAARLEFEVIRDSRERAGHRRVIHAIRRRAEGV